MKTDTKTNDLKKLIDMANLRKMANEQMDILNGVIGRVVKGVNDMTVVEPCITVAKEYEKNAVEAEEVYKKIPLKRRKYVEDLRSFMYGYGLGLARKGGIYSGNVKHEVRFETNLGACAQTYVSFGEKYSKSSKYSKNNALHSICLNCNGLVFLYDNQELLSLAHNLGVNLISLKEGGEAVFFKVNNKQITYFNGWFAFSADKSVAAYSTVSKDDAQQSLQRKIKSISSKQMK